MMHIYFIETDDFIKNLLTQTLDQRNDITITDDESIADILIKIDGSNAHFYGYEKYRTLEFPCFLKDFLYTIKAIYNEHFTIKKDNFTLEYNKLTYNHRSITLSSKEIVFIQKIMEMMPKGVDKIHLEKIFKQGGDPILYRLRKKLSEIGAGLTLEAGKYSLQEL